jgi:hypothetical protein
VRDGHDCAYSMSRHPFFRVRVARLVSRNPDLPVQACLAQAIDVHRYGSYWSAMMLKTQRWLQQQSSASHHVMLYEDLMSAPERTLARLIDFLGVGADPSFVARGAALCRPTGGQWRALPAQQQLLLSKACRPGMRVLEQLRRSS